MRDTALITYGTGTVKRAVTQHAGLQEHAVLTFHGTHDTHVRRIELIHAARS
jgi:hypothetical protein